MENNIYAQIALPLIPRILSAMDRKKTSKTYGCLDRYFWRYNMIDFPGSNYQIAALPLALVYTYQFPSNPYYHNQKVKEWSIAALEYLPETQNSDGTMNECYPYIWSVDAVAFPIYATSEAYMLLKDDLTDSSKEKILETFERAGTWLMKTADSNVINQESGALISLYNLYLVIGDERFKKGAEEKLSFLLQHRSSEGWFNEYGGGDIAYLTVTINSLAQYYLKTHDGPVLEILKDALEFISYFVHPNGTMGGEYASRNPEFIIPSGFEALRGTIPQASIIADSIISGLRYGQIINPMTVDEMYLCWMLHTYLQAYLHYQPHVHNNTVLPYMRPEVTQYYPHAGIFAIKRGEYYMIVGGSKGGIVRVYDCSPKGNLIFCDCGYAGVTKTGQAISSQWLDPSNAITFDEEHGRISVSGTFHKVSSTLNSPAKMVLSRVGLYSISKVPFARERLYQQLRKLMITGNTTIPIEFNRNITFDGDRIAISDQLHFKEKIEFAYFNVEDKFSPIYAQSTEFFQIQELSPLPAIHVDNLVGLIEGRDHLEIVREINPANKEIKCTISCDGQILESR